MEDSVKLINVYTKEEATILDCIVNLKRILQPKGCAFPEEVKKLICDWIDCNLITCIS